MLSKNFLLLENKIRYSFKNKNLLQNAFVHRSYLNEHKDFHLPSNEKMEFLGDSVLSLATTIYLYNHYPDLDEGRYTDIKAAAVRTESLAEIAGLLDLGECLFLSKGEEANTGKNNKNILADSFEALIAAVFLDAGFDRAYQFITDFLFKKKVDKIMENKLYLSPKSRLQEQVQASHKCLPEYRVTKESGPEHSKHFEVAVFIKGSLAAKGEGDSKKEAEEMAAKNALAKIQ